MTCFVIWMSGIKPRPPPGPADDPLIIIIRVSHLIFVSLCSPLWLQWLQCLLLWCCCGWCCSSAVAGARTCDSRQPGDSRWLSREKMFLQLTSLWRWQLGQRQSGGRGLGETFWKMNQFTFCIFLSPFTLCHPDLSPVLCCGRGGRAGGRPVNTAARSSATAKCWTSALNIPVDHLVSVSSTTKSLSRKMKKVWFPESDRGGK